MSMRTVRPNPDTLLKQITASDKKSRRGHFRLFFGMAAGVGKTYAMLRAAKDRLEEGVDVQVGIVETHERVDTKALLAGLPLIPRKKIEYRGTVLEEMDLDEILRRKPGLVLVDELAHTNVPGARHEKRYQDVFEILEAGIDVFATMNVQHLESRSDIVGLITATPVRETVPDSIMDWVDQIEIIDLTPEALLERLREGKVYPGRKVDHALQYFFQEKHLSALREIMLRVTADKVDRDTRGAFVKASLIKPDADEKKLLVAVSPSPQSDRLIRMARRLVEDLEVSWIAVHVDTGRVIDTKRHNQLIKNLDLARELGAETVTLHGTDVVSTISQYAQDHGVIQIVMGRPEKPKFWQWRAKALVQRLVESNPQADVTVMQSPRTKSNSEPLEPKSFATQGQHFLKALLGLALTTAGSYFFAPLIGYRAVGFLYLLNVVVTSVFTPFTVVLSCAAASALLWNYLFIPPMGTFAISEPEDIMMCLAYFIISSVTGYLTAQIRKNQNILKNREETTRALYDLLKSMTFVKGQKAIISLAVSKIESLFAAQCCVLAGKSVEDLSSEPEFGHLNLTDNDRAVAVWAFEHGRMAGWSTDTLPSSKIFCLALKSGEQKFGVLALKPAEDRKLNPEQQNLLFSIANQISVALAKERYEDEAKKAAVLEESERLHQTLLNCISHELRTPLTAILGAATALQAQAKTNSTSVPILAGEIAGASERLNQIFENLLDMTRVESGLIKLHEEWFDLTELLAATIERQKRFLNSHRVSLNNSQTPFYFYGDYELLSHVFSNLLLNAAKYSPIGSEIQVKFAEAEQAILIEIQDQGPGLPAESIPQLFEKFYRVPGSAPGGLGLGLSIAKNLVELHGGQIKATNAANQGSVFVVKLPRHDAPQQIREASV